MERFWLRVRAPFAAFRTFQAGVYRATSPVMPPSVAYGLVLNLAGIEMREYSPKSATTLIRTDLPSLRIALGIIRPPELCSLYQQLHTYPVGNSGADFQARTHGAKYWIAPTRRELLVDYDGIIGVESPPDLALHEQVSRGLRGELGRARYGLPFAGDNNFLFDRLETIDQPEAAHWYAPLASDDEPRKGSCRLTIGIDRADNSKTTSALLAPTIESTVVPPDSAWTWTPRQPDN